jgi:hypothetical protein
MLYSWWQLTLDWLKDGVLLEDSNHTVYGLQTLDNNNKVSLLNILDLKVSTVPSFNPFLNIYTFLYVPSDQDLHYSLFGQK